MELVYKYTDLQKSAQLTGQKDIGVDNGERRRTNDLQLPLTEVYTD
jgi:hypothetical protein